MEPFIITGGQQNEQDIEFPAVFPSVIRQHLQQDFQFTPFPHASQVCLTLGWYLLSVWMDWTEWDPNRTHNYEDTAMGAGMWATGSTAAANK